MFTGVSSQSKPGGLTCGSCPQGMKGNGTSCKGKIPMFNGVFCQSKPGGFTCGSCPPGMKGNGTSCKFKICLLEYPVSLNLEG